MSNKVDKLRMTVLCECVFSSSFFAVVWGLIKNPTENCMTQKVQSFKLIPMKYKCVLWQYKDSHIRWHLNDYIHAIYHANKLYLKEYHGTWLDTVVFYGTYYCVKRVGDEYKNIDKNESLCSCKCC